MLSISGIRFDANAPKKTEIGYAIELFSRFLDTHKDKVLAYVTAKREFSALPTPDGSNLAGEASSYGSPTVRYRPSIPGIGYIEIGRNKVFISIALTDEFTVTDLNTLTAESLVDSAPFFAEHAIYTERQKQLIDMQSALTKCDI